MVRRRKVSPARWPFGHQAEACWLQRGGSASKSGVRTVLSKSRASCWHYLGGVLQPRAASVSARRPSLGRSWSPPRSAVGELAYAAIPDPLIVTSNRVSFLLCPFRGSVRAIALERARHQVSKRFGRHAEYRARSPRQHCARGRCSAPSQTGSETAVKSA